VPVEGQRFPRPAEWCEDRVRFAIRAGKGCRVMYPQSVHQAQVHPASHRFVPFHRVGRVVFLSEHLSRGALCCQAGYFINRVTAAHDQPRPR